MIYALTREILALDPMEPCIVRFTTYLSQRFPKYHPVYCIELVLFYFITKIHEDNFLSISDLSVISHIKYTDLLKLEKKFFDCCVQDNFRLMRIITFTELDEPTC